MSNGVIRVEDQGVLEWLNRLQQRMADRRPLMRQIAGIMHHSVEENFAQGGRPEKWKPSKRVLKYGGQTLIDKAQLINSIHEFSDNDQAGVGTNKVYAGVQNFGGDITIPAHERVIHFKAKKQGEITWSKPGTGDLFSTRKKASYTIKRMIGSYIIHIPKREFMILPELDLGAIRAKIAEYYVGRE